MLGARCKNKWVGPQSHITPPASHLTRHTQHPYKHNLIYTKLIILKRFYATLVHFAVHTEQVNIFCTQCQKLQFTQPNTINWFWLDFLWQILGIKHCDTRLVETTAINADNVNTSEAPLGIDIVMAFTFYISNLCHFTLYTDNKILIPLLLLMWLCGGWWQDHLIFIAELPSCLASFAMPVSRGNFNWYWVLAEMQILMACCVQAGSEKEP